MQRYIPRSISSTIAKKMAANPVVALLGARQVGKSTIARELIRKAPNALYLDLEKASDRQKVESDPELFFRANKDSLIFLDEIQLLPELFRSIRSHVDESERNGQLLVLGSASGHYTAGGPLGQRWLSPFYSSD